MIALILALMTYCPLLSGGVLAATPQHNDDFSYMGSRDWIVYIQNPTPFKLSTHEIELVLKDVDADSFLGNRVEIKPTTVAPNSRTEVHFQDDALDIRRLAGSLIVCDGIRP